MKQQENIESQVEHIEEEMENPWKYKHPDLILRWLQVKINLLLK